MRSLAILSLILLLWLASPTRADKPAPPGTYTSESADGRYVFVMLSPEATEVELKWYNEDHQKVVQSIRARYAKSGLYKNDGSKDPLWTVDWYRHSVLVASDGLHLVRLGDWPTLERRLKDKNRTVTANDLKQEAFTLFARGKLAKTFTIGDVVIAPQRLKMSVSHFMWLQNARIDDAKGRLEVATLDGNRVALEFATGKVVKLKD